MTTSTTLHWARRDLMTPVCGARKRQPIRFAYDANRVSCSRCRVSPVWREARDRAIREVTR